MQVFAQIDEACLRYSDYVGEPIGNRFNNLNTVMSNASPELLMYKFKACVSSSDRFLNLFQLTLANEKGKSQLELPEVGTQQKGDSCATILFPTKQDMYMSEIFYDETGEEMTYEDSETGEIMELAGRIIGIKSYFDG